MNLSETVRKVIGAHPDKMVKPVKVKKGGTTTGVVEKDAYGQRVTAKMSPVNQLIHEFYLAGRADLCTAEILSEATGKDIKKVRPHLAWFDRKFPGILSAPVFIPVTPATPAAPAASTPRKAPIKQAHCL